LNPRLASLLFVASALLALPGAAQETFRYPPPELGPEYVEPESHLPEQSELVSPLADAGLLTIAILVASWLVHRRRSRAGLLTLAVACLVWFGFIREGCVCAVGSIQNVAEALVDPEAPILPATLLVFTVPLIATLLWGRTFCASVCPLGALQEVLLLRPTSLPSWLGAGLSLLPHAYLALAVLYATTGAGYLICRYDPFVGFFRLGATVDMLVFGGCLVLISVFVGRPYCRFLCPYGVLLAWAAKLSWKPVTITPDACATCRLCEDTCPYGAIREPNPIAVRTRPLRGRRTLVAALIFAPLLVLGMGWSGSLLGPELARGHPRVALAEQIEAEESGRIRETTDAGDVFRGSGETVAALATEAEERRADFVLGGWLAGGFVGLMIALRILAFSIRRTRVEYEADRELCLACGRCFDWCPVELERRKSGVVPEVRAP